MTILLTLILSGLSSQHQITALSYDWPRNETYVEFGVLYVCSDRFTFTFDGKAMTARMETDKCVRDVVFTNGFGG